MNHLKNFARICTLLLSLNVSAQKLTLKEGNFDKISSQSQFNVELTFDSLKIKSFDSEAQYMDYCIKYINKQHKGEGDVWAVNWIADREKLLKPRFCEAFNKFSSTDLNEKAKYTIIFHTIFIDMGPNPTGMNDKQGKQVSVDGEIIIVETVNRNNKIAIISVEDAKGGAFGGGTYDTCYQLAEAYAKTGKRVAKLITK
jgi:hypothetical protein